MNQTRFKTLFSKRAIRFPKQVPAKLFDVLYGILSAHLIFLGICFLHGLYRIDYTVMPHSLFYRLSALGLPPLLWIASTSSEPFNYHKKKIAAYILVACSEILVLSGILFQLLSHLFLPKIFSIHTDEIFTKRMVLFLARLVTELPSLLFIALCIKSSSLPLRQENARSALLSFRLSNRKLQKDSSRKVHYPLTIAKEIKSGRPVVISENDRYLHTLVDGTSGTGKTSSTLLPAIKDDLNMRCNAENQQLKQLQPFLERNQISYTGESRFFSINNFVTSGTTDDEQAAQIRTELENIRITFPVCGITVLAPDDSLTDDVCNLCEARKVPYHRIDAARDEDGSQKKNWTGMNPFYLSPSLSGELLHQAIVKKAVIFSDVMQVITDLKGKADSYFTGLNRQMLANLSILVMNTIPVLHRRQATPADLQELINNFDLLPEHVSRLEMLDSKDHRYAFILQYIKEDLLGKGRTKMEDQSRGTRNIINEFLLMPGSKEVYCSQSSIDFDQALRNGEVTVCNYDLASGDSNAVAFGLFFLLSFNNAVLSRPGTEKTRIPHYFYIDELPVLLHSSLEKNFSLFRKFRVAMFCAIQTLDQFEKNEITKYLKGVVLGSAHIFVFGRSSLSDMEVFSSMSGVHDKIEEQTTTSETALSGESPSLSYSSREILTQKNVLEEVDIRLRDFQEITLFTTRDGRPLPPIHAKVSFLRPSDWDSSSTPSASSSADFLKRVSHSPGNLSPEPGNTPPVTADILPLNQKVLSRFITSVEQNSETPMAAPSNGSNVPQSNEASETHSPLPNGSETIDDLF